MDYGDHIKPEWANADRAPLCTERCPSHDGKRCMVLGHRPQSVCEPAADIMAERLVAAEQLARDLRTQAKGCIDADDVQGASDYRAFAARIEFALGMSPPVDHESSAVR